MLILGCDFHPGFEQVAIFDNVSGEMQEKRLQHRAEAEEFAGRRRASKCGSGWRPAGTIPGSSACWRS